MHYDYFMGMVQQLETDRVVAYQGQEYKLSNQLPDAFVLLLPEIMRILHNVIDTLCKPNEKLVILGIQPAAQMPASVQPIHVANWCCTLDYSILPAHQPSDKMRWRSTHSLVIDFASGYMMDPATYLNFLTQSGEIDKSGMLGQISESALKTAWKVLKIKNKPYKF